ncbi:hypothetical protein Pmani_035501 [Petrolisthes manimaculis]|uniref:Uncharacterized protein n=1 Tax=Petrolisthes manimaculis TaxID=1843537 RepID=A0AAE1TL27_9EUCA|nr:hypothetical protein Pmani_039730 [Petrolisthes manimaculis]KAK4291687.1 hypothetical protein Pmani_035501 [Petrolisthes manimaculis]
MKKSKLLSRLLRGGSGGSTKQPAPSGPELGEAGVAPNPVVAAHSTSGRRRETVAVSTPSKSGTSPRALYQQQQQAAQQQKAGVERSSSWKYTHDHTPDSFSINSSPSILDGRGGVGLQERAEETHTIEKSQSWSGDRLLDCATDSGSSRGGTTSRAGSGSRAGSRTGTSSRSSRDRAATGAASLPASSRAGSRTDSRTGSRAGSDRGDSTPSSVYEHAVDHSPRATSQTDADGYENVDLPSPQRDRDSGSSSEQGSSSRQLGSRLSVKSGGRRSRRPSPRRHGILSKTVQSQESTESRGSRGSSVRGNVPSISLSTSSPVPPPKTSVNRSPSRKSRRSPSKSPSRPQSRPPSRSPSRSDSSRKRDSRRSSRSPKRGPDGSPGRTPSRSPVRVGSRSSPGDRDPWTRMIPLQDTGSARYNGDAHHHLPSSHRSMSCEEPPGPGTRSPQPPLLKARSWQQYSIGHGQSTPQSERARQLAKSRSWQQQQTMPAQSVDAGRSRHHHITRQEAVQAHPAAMGKSRSWQQSHDADPLPGPLPRTYTVSERRGRRSSVRLAPPSPTRPSPPSYSHSPARSPLAALPPQSHPSSNTHTSIHDKIHLPNRPPPLRTQASMGSYGTPGTGTPHLTEYVELRNYEAMERQQQQQQEYVDLRQYRAEQLRPTTRDPVWRERYYIPATFAQMKQLQQQQQLQQQHLQQQQLQQQQLQYQKQQYQQQAQQQFMRQKQRTLQHQKSIVVQPGYDSQYGSPARMDGEYASLQEIRDAAVRNGSVRDARYREGSIRDARMREGSVRDGAPRQRLSTAAAQAKQQQGQHQGPVKSSSLMTSQELLNTLKRQLALSSPTRTTRSKSLEAGRAAAAAAAESGREELGGVHAREVTEEVLAETLSPALMALVAEKRARLKRSAGAFSGSGGGRVAVLRQVTAPPARCTVLPHALTRAGHTCCPRTHQLALA